MSAIGELKREVSKLGLGPEDVEGIEIKWGRNPKGIFYLSGKREPRTRETDDKELIDLMKLAILESEGELYPNQKAYKNFLIKTIPLRSALIERPLSSKLLRRLPIEELQIMYDELGEEIQRVGVDTYKTHLLTQFEMMRLGSPYQAYVRDLERGYKDIHPLSLELACALDHNPLRYI